jgi:hypothetical protein
MVIDKDVWVVHRRCSSTIVIFYRLNMFGIRYELMELIVQSSTAQFSLNTPRYNKPEHLRSPINISQTL